MEYILPTISVISIFFTILSFIRFASEGETEDLIAAAIFLVVTAICFK